MLCPFQVYSSVIWVFCLFADYIPLYVITRYWCQLNKNAQHDSCVLSFIWGKIRTTAQETAFQRALRNCSTEVVGKVSIYVILVKGEHMQSSTYFFLQKVSASHEEQSSP